MEENLLTAKEVRKFLNISSATFWRLLKNEKFPAPLKIGTGSRGSHRWRPQDIKEFLDQKQREN